MQVPFPERSSSILSAILIFLTLIGALLVGGIALSPRDSLIFLIGCGLIALLFAVRSLESAFRAFHLFFLIALAVGWRGLWVTRDLRFYAGEVIIWFVAILYLFTAPLMSRTKKVPLHIPPILLILIIPIGAFALWQGVNYGRPWDVLWAEYKGWLVAIPIFAYTGWVIQTRAQWDRAILVYIGAMVYISLFGILEYFVGRSLNFFGATEVPIYSDTSQGFTRALFTFWGHPSVVVLIVPAAGILLAQIANFKAIRPGALPIRPLVILALIGGATYVAGHRGGWVALAGCVAVFVLINLKTRWPLLVLMIIGLFFIPETVYDNLRPLLYGTDRYFDSSVIKRFAFIQGTLDLISLSPIIGSGWSASGWVHNEYLQYAANLGLPAALLFIGWYLSLGWRLWRKSHGTFAHPDPDTRNLLNGLLGGWVAFALLLASEVIVVLTPIAIGYWAFLALMERFVWVCEDQPVSKTLFVSGTG
jgi:hypothetical protein